MAGDFFGFITGSSDDSSVSESKTTPFFCFATFFTGLTSSEDSSESLSGSIFFAILFGGGSNEGVDSLSDELDNSTFGIAPGRGVFITTSSDSSLLLFVESAAFFFFFAAFSFLDFFFFFFSLGGSFSFVAGGGSFFVVEFVDSSSFFVKVLFSIEASSSLTSVISESITYLKLTTVDREGVS